MAIRNIFVFSLYSFVDSSVPWLAFETNVQSIQSSIYWNKIYIDKKAKTKEQLIEKYGHLSFDMLYLYGKI